MIIEFVFCWVFIFGLIILLSLLFGSHSAYATELYTCACVHFATYYGSHFSGGNIS